MRLPPPAGGRRSVLTASGVQAYDGAWTHTADEADHPLNCGHAEEMAGMPVVCFDLAGDEHDFDESMAWFENITTDKDGRKYWASQIAPDYDEATCDGTAGEAVKLGGSDSTDCAAIFAASDSKGSPSCPVGCTYDADVYMEYQTADQTQERPYSSYTGIAYPSGGYLVRNIQKMFRNPPTLQKAGNELFPWPHKAIDASELINAGLLHAATRVIFHDYTIYSATKDSYVNVRLTLEIGLDHGVFIPSRHVRLVRLTAWPEYSVAFEMLFYAMLLVLALENVWFFVSQVFDAEEALEEALELARFELRYHILEQAAFGDIFAYRPRVLMKQIEVKVRKVKPDRSHHIAALNKLGCRIAVLHDRFQRLMNMDPDSRTSGKPEDKATAILAILNQFELVKERVVDLNTLKATTKSPVMLMKRWLIRIENAAAVFSADTYRVLDMINYGFFFITFVLRLKINPLMDKALVSISAIGRNDPYADSNYVQLYELTFWVLVLTYAYAVNAVLTWLKVFKFFSYFPSMQILTRTLGYAAGPLISFSVILMVVLIAFGQAFFLSFGLDLLEYRTFSTSVFALLRMAVGDFDYVALEQSHNLLGPTLFWMYIFLVFFILMSVFIALISEAYEMAKVELAAVAEAVQHSSVVDDPVRTIDEARHKLGSVTHGLVSSELLASLKESLPKPPARRSTSFRGLVSKAWCGKSDEKKWRTGPLSDRWDLGPVDIFDNVGHEWVNVNDLQPSPPVLGKAPQIEKGMVVCKISEPQMKGVVLRRQNRRACVDFNDIVNARAGLASLTNLLGSSSAQNKGLKSSLSRALSRAPVVQEKHPTEWNEKDVVNWAKQCGIPGVVEVADNFAEHGVNGQCLLHLDRADLKDIGVSKIADLKVAASKIRLLSKMPKKLTMAHQGFEDKKNKGGKNNISPRPPDKPKLPSQATIVEIDECVDQGLEGGAISVHKLLLNNDSKWVKVTRGDAAFYQNTAVEGLNSLKMPLEGVRGEKVLDENDPDSEPSFKMNYDKAVEMDQAKQIVGGIAGPPVDAEATARLAEQIRSAEWTG